MPSPRMTAIFLTIAFTSYGQIIESTERTVAFGFHLGLFAVSHKCDIDPHHIVFTHKVEVGNFNSAVEIQITSSLL